MSTMITSVKYSLKGEEVIDIDKWLFKYIDKDKLYKYLYIHYKQYQVHPKVAKILKKSIT